MSDPRLHQTPLHELHLELGARMVPFAGYSMPVQYTAGLIAEHRHCRASAALFDVSHMGQIRLVGDAAAAALETLVPVDVIGLAPGRQRYAFFTNADGGLLDDLMVARPLPGSDFGDVFLIVNAGCKQADLAHLVDRIGDRCSVIPMPERALLALQGPLAVAALARLNAGVATMKFMDAQPFELAGAACHVTRSGYTGEDGFEISVPAQHALALAHALLAQPEVKPAGLGARDTLRLEMGMALYGNDIDDTTTPLEANLGWLVKLGKGDFVGRDALVAQKERGLTRKLVGFTMADRNFPRHGYPVFYQGEPSGIVCSGTMSPTLGIPIGTCYLPIAGTKEGTTFEIEIRGKRVPATVTKPPFYKHASHL